jgi:hypothetical protein
MIPVVLLLVIAWVLIKRRDDQGDEYYGDPSPINPLQPQLLAGNLPGAQGPGGAHDAGGGTFIPPNANNTGSVNCAEHPDVCKKWRDDQSREGIKTFQTVQGTLLSVVPVAGPLLHRGLSYLENKYWVGSGSSRFSYVPCYKELEYGATIGPDGNPIVDNLGNPVGNCTGVPFPKTQTQLEHGKYLKKRQGDFVPGAKKPAPKRATVRK